MKKILYTSVLISFFISTVTHSKDIRNDSNEAIKTYGQGFIVDYGDGKEKYLAEYRSMLRLYREQTGEASKTVCKWEKLLPECEVNIIDNRECSWTIGTNIVRRLYFVNRAGELFEKKDAFPEQIFGVSHRSRGEGPKWTRLHSQTCGEAERNFNNEVTWAKNGLLSQFQNIVKDDAEQVAKELKTKLKAVKVAAVK